MQLCRISCLFMLAALGAMVAPSAALASDHPTFESGDWRLSLDGQYRPRAQADSGKDFLGDTLLQRQWVSHRARFGVVAARKDGPQVVLRLQDTRIWGEESEPLGSGTQSGAAMGLDVHEAYALVPLGVAGLTLKAGRQEVNLDAHRLVGNVDWTQRARSFDGARLQWQGNGLDVSLLATLINEREPLLATDAAMADGHVPPGRLGDIYFGGLHARYAVNKNHRVSAMFLSRKNDSSDPAANELRHTAGLFANGAVDALSYTAEGYYQFGHAGAQDIAAWMGGARVAYALPLPATPTVSAWYEELSGDGNARRAFDTLYATNHKFYGEMDFFLNIPKHTGNRGLRDIAVAASAAPLANLSVGADLHFFGVHELSGDALTAAKGVQPATDLGQELDVRVNWKIQPGVGLHALYGLFLPGDGMRAVKKIAAAAAMTNEHFGALTLDVSF